MAGPNININIGAPRRRRRRRAVAGGGALIALIIAALLGYSRVGSPPRAQHPRLPTASAALEHLRSLSLGKGLEQIPATVVDRGPLRHVPYLSYRFGHVEFNAYGDPDAPASLEIGLFGAPDPGVRAQCRDALASLLQDAADRRLLQDLDRGKQTRAGLTAEITPESAPDAYGGWWVSVYDLKALDASRASEAELKGVTGPRPSGDEAARARPGSAVYVKGYYRKDGSYVACYEKKAKQ